MARYSGWLQWSARQRGTIRRVVVAAYACSVLAIPAAGCRQSVDLPRRGETARQVEEKLGKPTSTVRSVNAGIRQSLAAIDGCREATVSNGTEVWFYAKRFRSDVVVVFDSGTRVVCAGHGGITFVS